MTGVTLIFGYIQPKEKPNRPYATQTEKKML